VETAYRAQGSLLRKEYGAVVELNGSHDADHTDLSLTDDDVPGGPLRRGAIAVARQRAFELRRDDVIGNDAYRVLVQELDWAELSAGGGRVAQSNSARAAPPGVSPLPRRAKVPPHLARSIASATTCNKGAAASRPGSQKGLFHRGGLLHTPPV
jgi:hypothetical protein